MAIKKETRRSVLSPDKTYTKFPFVTLLYTFYLFIARLTFGIQFPILYKFKKPYPYVNMDTAGAAEYYQYSVSGCNSQFHAVITVLVYHAITSISLVGI